MKIGNVGITDTERRYYVFKLELGGLVFALKAYRHFLKGATYPITVFIYHRALEGKENR